MKKDIWKSVFAYPEVPKNNPKTIIDPHKPYAVGITFEEAPSIAKINPGFTLLELTADEIFPGTALHTGSKSNHDDDGFYNGEFSKGTGSVYGHLVRDVALSMESGSYKAKPYDHAIFLKIGTSKAVNTFVEKLHYALGAFIGVDIDKHLTTEEKNIVERGRESMKTYLDAAQTSIQYEADKKVFKESGVQEVVNTPDDDLIELLRNLNPDKLTTAYSGDNLPSTYFDKNPSAGA